MDYKDIASTLEEFRVAASRLFPVEKDAGIDETDRGDIHPYALEESLADLLERESATTPPSGHKRPRGHFAR